MDPSTTATASLLSLKETTKMLNLKEVEKKVSTERGTKPRFYQASYGSFHVHINDAMSEHPTLKGAQCSCLCDDGRESRCPKYVASTQKSNSLHDICGPQHYSSVMSLEDFIYSVYILL